MAKRMYYGGTVLTMEDILYAQALLVEDGVIRAVGSEAEVRAAAGRDCEMVDLKGHTLMPAFIDAHSHFSGCANALLQVPLGEAVSFDEIEERIAAFIRDNHISKGQWVAAQGFDHNVLREKRPPRREVLDRAAPDNPVIMAHQSGHTGVLNTLAPDQLSRAAQNGMIPSFFVAHVYHWGDVHLENLGPERAARISPAASAGAQGLRYTFHQDAPVIQPDMLETVWCAVNRVTKQGTVLGPQERVPVLDALRAVTINAAYQYFEEGSKGSLRPGKRADLVILEEDPLKALPMHLRDIRILETVKDGKTIYRTDI